MKKSVEDLLSEASAGAKGNGCRFSQLKGNSKDFMQGITLAYSQGRKVSQVKVRHILQREFDVLVSTSLISEHLRGLCSCEPKNSKN